MSAGDREMPVDSIPARSNEVFRYGPEIDDQPKRSLRFALMGLALNQVRERGVERDSTMYELLTRWYKTPVGTKELCLSTTWCQGILEDIESETDTGFAAQGMRNWIGALENRPVQALQGHQALGQMWRDVGGWAWEVAMEATPEGYRPELRAVYGLLAIRALRLGNGSEDHEFAELAEAIVSDSGALSTEHWAEHVAQAHKTMGASVPATLAKDWMEVVESELASPQCTTLLRKTLELALDWALPQTKETDTKRATQGINDSDRIAKRIAAIAGQIPTDAPRWSVERALRPIGERNPKSERGSRSRPHREYATNTRQRAPADRHWDSGGWRRGRKGSRRGPASGHRVHRRASYRSNLRHVRRMDVRASGVGKARGERTPRRQVEAPGPAERAGRGGTLARMPQKRDKNAEALREGPGAKPHPDAGKAGDEERRRSPVSEKGRRWKREQDSNLRPSDYESDALPTAPPREASRIHTEDEEGNQ